MAVKEKKAQVDDFKTLFSYALCLLKQCYIFHRRKKAITVLRFLCPGQIPFFLLRGLGVKGCLPTKCPCSLTKINMAAVILSATVFREQYLKHPMIPLAFIWRTHRHTTGMSHKHVEAFQRHGGGGMEGGGGGGGGVSNT